jgi:dTDP-glucose 4,6-dehydratase
MRRVLLTGGAGFIGSNFVHHWIRGHADDRLVVLDALTYAGNRLNLAPVENQGGSGSPGGATGFRFVHGNICDGALVTR